jgi:predicted membrane metal-binding protein
MIYVKSLLAGAVLLIGCVALLTFALDVIFFLDLRAIMGAFPFISVPAMLAIFVIGFIWQLRRTRRRSAALN